MPEQWLPSHQAALVSPWLEIDYKLFNVECVFLLLH
jgi:hypothetical protein